MGVTVLTASAADAYLQMKPAMILLAVILGVLILFSVAFTVACMRAKGTKQQRKAHSTILVLTYLTTALVLVCTVACFFRYRSLGDSLISGNNPTKPVVTDPTNPGSSDPSDPTGPSNPTTGVTDPTDPPTVPTEPEPTFTPEHTSDSDPDNWGIDWDIITGGSVVDSYTRPESISFGKPEDYFALPGIATFRGNNFRNSPAYGSADVVEEKLEQIWRKNVGSLNGWPGCGWTGQPLMVQWDAETKAIMNMYESKKAKKDLVEVIYATLDGYIYFYDLDDGSYTRNPINVGMNFKGAGALDPRGYPLMYVGSGDFIGSKVPRMYIISLIDGKILYERSGSDSFSLRNWAAFDSSPLVDAETDTLIWPAETGILYTMKLNTNYDKAAGTIKINPQDIVKTRYSTDRSLTGNYWLGYEPSAVIVDRYLYISENGGMFFCIDLDTMKLVWAQDTRDDSNSTPVFEWNGKDGGYVYTAPSLHWTAQNNRGYISVYKLDAKTGEVVWETKFNCNTYPDVSGGVQSTPLLGKPGTELEGLIIYSIARTPDMYNGRLVALSTETGEIVWEKPMGNYTWSSPLAIYDDDGKAYVIICDSLGYMILMDSKLKVLNYIELGSNIEASPAAFNNMIVVGTRAGHVYGVKIK